MARILDGTVIAAAIKQEVAGEVQLLTARGIRPGLAAVLVGSVPASQIYVRNKVKICGEVGIFSDLITRPETATTAELVELVASLNARDEIDGILVQLPLPKQVDVKAVLDAIDPAKDVDGLHPVNAGLLQAGRPGLAPCTPAGVIEILKRSGIAISGQRAVVVGQNLGEITRQADILVAAIGRAGFITAEMVKPGATLIDVGINRIDTRAEFDRFFAGNAKREASFAKRGSTLVGDIDPKAFEVAGAYTPVPGGVGLLTTAMLMANTVRAARMRRGA
jgi:methylenetetrahydrofolate dehydrogenase (NADP+)/methenyltetrahydrofolate cyclohydrolase